MFRDVKICLLCCQFLLLIPIENLLTNDVSRLEIRLFSSKTLICIFTKWSMYVIFLLSWYKPYQLPFFGFFVICCFVHDVVLSFSSIRLLLISTKIVEKIDSTRFVSIRSTNAIRFYWYCTLIAVLFLHFGSRFFFPIFKIVLPSTTSKIIFSFITIPTIWTPFTYIIFCVELKKRFVALDEKITEICRLMNESNTIFFCDHKIWRDQIESARLTYSALCEATEMFVRGADFPITFYFFGCLSEALNYAYMFFIINIPLTPFHVWRFSHNIICICFITIMTDYLREAVRLLTIHVCTM